MEPLERLDMILGAELQAAGGILDRLDYRQVRRLGVQLRNIPTPAEDWDLPPSSLQGWIASFQASTEALRVASECGLLRLLQAHSDDIHSALSLEIIPAIDQEIADLKTIEELIATTKDHDRLKELNLEKVEARLPSQTELAQVLVVQLGVSLTWSERPKVDERTGLKRLKVGALLGQVALGGALAVGNLALGVVGGIIISIPGIINSIPLSLGLVGSTYTGFNGLLSAIDKLTDALKDLKN